MKILARPLVKPDNPYTQLLYKQLADLGVRADQHSPVKLLLGTYDIWHLHWPESGLAFSSYWKATHRVLGLAVLIKLAKLRGVKIVWTTHNLRSHENYHPKLEKWFWNFFTRNIDGFISLSNTSQQMVVSHLSHLENKPCTVTYHGHYRAIYQNEISKDKARSLLSINSSSKVLAFVGQIRPYKNALNLIRLFREIEDQEAVLLIAGKPNCLETEQSIRDAARGESRILLFLETVPDQSLQIYFNAADMIVIPYTKILNSGSALLSLSFDRPILVPAQGSLVELQRLVGKKWIRTYNGELTKLDLVQALTAFCLEIHPNSAPLGEFEWPTIAQNTLSFYERMVSDEHSFS